MRERLRRPYSAAELERIYPAPHDAERWHDHHVRVAVTIALARGFEEATSVADLSCGNGQIARALGLERCVLGDLAAGYEHVGPVEKTLAEIEPVDLFICSETLEHLDDPDSVLRSIREKADGLICSTPIDAGEADRANREHYWAWGREDVEEMLTDNGWRILAYCSLDMRPGWSPYHFGIWAAR